MKKKLIFWRKAWISIFLTFLKVLFSGLKTNLFHLKYPETIFSGLMYPKIHLRKSSIFWQKAWTKPFGKVRYFGLFWNFTFFTQMHFILSIIFKNDLLWLKFPPKKQLRKRLRFFHKKHRLINPLQKFDVLNFYKSRLFWSKNQSFLFGISKNNLFWLDVSKDTFEKKFDFLKKRMDPKQFWENFDFLVFF